MAEFKKLSEVEAVRAVQDNANVLIEEDGVIKKAPKTAVGGGGIKQYYILVDTTERDEEGSPKTEASENIFQIVKNMLEKKEIIDLLLYYRGLNGSADYFQFEIFH